MNEKPRLYYDAACPVCSKEIALVKRLARNIDFVDVHALNDESLPTGRTRNALLRDLHLTDRQGRWYVGLEANVQLWQYTPLAPLWRVLNWPILQPVAERLYRGWADRRFRKMGYCATGSDQSA